MADTNSRPDVTNQAAAKSTATETGTRAAATGSTPVIHETGAQDEAAQAADMTKAAPAEIGGRDGPEPTRFGDWEKAGRCIDF